LNYKKIQVFYGCIKDQNRLVYLLQFKTPHKLIAFVRLTVNYSIVYKGNN